jgi:hypothetical protein
MTTQMYDCAAHQRITFIPWPHASPPPHLFRVHLHWANDTTLLLAWADCVKVTRTLALNSNLGKPNCVPKLLFVTLTLDSNAGGPGECTASGGGGGGGHGGSSQVRRHRRTERSDGEG